MYWLSDKKRSKIFILLISLIFLTGCQGYKDEIESLELENEKLKVELSTLEDEFNDYKNLMSPYEKIHNSKETAIKELEKLNFLENKSKYINEIKAIDGSNEVNKKLEEIKKLESTTKDKYISEFTEKINNLDHLPKDKKAELISNLAEKSNEVDMKEVLLSGEKENRELEKIVKEKEEAIKKQEEANKQSKAQSQSSNQKNTRSSTSVGSTQTAPKEEGQVLVTPTGSKYHRRACGRGNYSPTSLSNAQARGLTPCAKCY